MVRKEGMAIRYLFGFNGQLKDNEIYGEGNAYAFEYRIQDPRLVRFLSVDPLRRDYPWNSPYAFAENKTINGGDLEGREFEIKIITGDNTKVILKALQAGDVEEMIKASISIFNSDTYRNTISADGPENKPIREPYLLNYNPDNQNLFTIFSDQNIVLFTVDKQLNMESPESLTGGGSWGESKGGLTKETSSSHAEDNSIEQNSNSRLFILFLKLGNWINSKLEKEEVPITKVNKGSKIAPVPQVVDTTIVAYPDHLDTIIHKPRKSFYGETVGSTNYINHGSSGTKASPKPLPTHLKLQEQQNENNK